MSDSCYFQVFEKLTRACFFQISLEIILPILNRGVIEFSTLKCQFTENGYLIFSSIKDFINKKNKFHAVRNM